MTSTLTPRRLLLGALVALLAILNVKGLLGTVLIDARFAVDLEIPLRAAERWLAGDAPYLADAFNSEPGPTQPFLYPPYVLPFFALLTDLPRLLVGIVAVGSMLAVSIAACRRLAIPWIWLPLVLTWPPFAEAIYGANIQTVLFAGFVFLFYRAGARAGTPRPRDVADPRESEPMIGGLATAVGAVKVSQPHAWLYVLRCRPRAAIGGAIVAAMLVSITLLTTGVSIWSDWAAQLRLAGDPTWDLGGFAIPRFLPGGLGYGVVGACLVAVWFVPRERAGAWTGVLGIIGSLSLHIFGLLFLLPGMLLIWRDAALLAAIFISTYSYEGAWAGIIVCAVGLTAVEWSSHSPAHAPAASAQGLT